MVVKYISRVLSFLAMVVLFGSCQKTTIPTIFCEEVYQQPQAIFNDVCFISDNSGFIVGSNSLAMRTDDGGKSWITFATDTFTNNIYSNVYFVNDSVGLIKYWNYYAYTTNKGISWEAKDTVPYRYVRKLFQKAHRNESTYFMDSLVGYQYNIQDVRKYGVIKRTKDAGKSWTEINTGQANKVLDMKFINATDGYAVGNSSLIRTFNQGDSWEYLRDQNGESFPADLIKISIVNQNLMYAISPTKLYKIHIKK